MKNRLKHALSLLNCTDTDTLISQFLAFSLPRSGFSALIVSLVNQAENCLESWSIDSNSKIEKRHLDIDISDADNPLIQLLTQGRPVLWRELHQGSYINNTALQQFIAKQPAHSGLYSIPLIDLHNKPCGVIVMIAQHIDKLMYEEGIFPIYCQLLSHQLKILLGLTYSQQKNHALTVFIVFTKRERRANQCHLVKSQPLRHTFNARIYGAFSQITDLTQAVEQYEAAILRHYQAQSDDNLNKISKNLNISNRYPLYKLKKYECLV